MLLSNLELAEILRDRKRSAARAAKAENLAKFAKVNAVNQRDRENLLDIEAMTEARAIRSVSSVRTFRVGS